MVGTMAFRAGSAADTAHESLRIQRAAWGYTTRRVPRGGFHLLHDGLAPRAGDLVLARVDAVGQHGALQLSGGRRRTLFPGDEIVVAYGNRYAPNQFEARVPNTLGPCHLVAGGGVAGKAISWHTRMSRGPTAITPLGMLANAAGEPVNLGNHALPPLARVPAPCPVTVAVAGTAMDSGKTQTAAHLVRGLVLAGLRVGYAKVTGTGSGGDTWLLRDAGANPVLDFTDAGHVSTYLVPHDEVARVFVTLVAHLAQENPDAIVLEVADGVLQSETGALLTSAPFREIVGGILFAAGDAMGAVAGHAWLRDRDLPLIGLGGVLTASPLQRQESADTTCLPVYSREDLAQAKIAVGVLTMAQGRSAAREETPRADEPRETTCPAAGWLRAAPAFARELEEVQP